MKSAYLIFTFVGIVIGYAAPRLLSKTPSNQTNGVSDGSKEQPHSNPTSKSTAESQTAAPSITAGQFVTDENGAAQSASGTTGSKKSGTSGSLDLAPLNIEQSCLDQIRPSHVRDLETMWSKKTQDFMETNDLIWNSRSKHAFNSTIYKSAMGKYKGTMQLNHNPTVAARLNIDLTSEKEGKFQYEVFEKQGQKGVSGNSTNTFNPSEAIGTDDAKNAINVFWHNGYPDIFGPDYKYFAFKLPADLFPKQKQSVEIYGLHETLEWKSVGSAEIEKL